MSGPAVVFDDVGKSFGRVRAVTGLDWWIPVGRTVALLGPNGAGKSTTVGLLLGLLRPARGRVEVLGTAPGRAVAAGRIGVMLQDGGLMPGVTVQVVLDFHGERPDDGQDARDQARERQQPDARADVAGAPPSADLPIQAPQADRDEGT